MYHLFSGLVDIFLIYYIYYRLIILLEGSRTVRVIWGIFVLAAITLLAEWLNLYTTAWIMQRLWLAGALALVIVFQPEIRRGLTNLGTSFAKIGGSSNPIGRALAMFSRSYSFIPEMIEAIRIASDERTGMLIVLEQDQGLKDVLTEEGIRLDAEVSKELLLTIFFDKTLLHDGAVIISNNRIAAAAAVLPVTDQKELSKVLGTRHRAALGLSENSDALVLVVSEESGRVSLARGGMLQRIDSLHDLEARLNDLYRSKAERSLLRKPGENKQSQAKNTAENAKSSDEQIKKENAEDRRAAYKTKPDILAVIQDFFFNPPEIFKNNWRIKVLSAALSMITYLYVLGGR